MSLKFDIITDMIYTWVSMLACWLPIVVNLRGRLILGLKQVWCSPIPSFLWVRIFEFVYFFYTFNQFCLSISFNSIQSTTKNIIAFNHSIYLGFFILISKIANNLLKIQKFIGKEKTSLWLLYCRNGLKSVVLKTEVDKDFLLTVGI